MNLEEAIARRIADSLERLAAKPVVVLASSAVAALQRIAFGLEACSKAGWEIARELREANDLAAIDKMFPNGIRAQDDDFHSKLRNNS
ncbi:MAG: hypothetical protein OXH11_19355, partial [Candidatus Aminicenantes bacterium]|nr:hypothetical protein [Candidatus Aminicenantes bacterium]